MSIKIVSHHDSARDEVHFALRSAIYGRHYRNIPRDAFVDEFDRFDDEGIRRSRLLGAWVDDNLLGTCRIIHYHLCRLVSHGSEIAELFNIDWNVLSEIRGVSIQKLRVAEISKFAITPNRSGFEVTRALLRSVGTESIMMGTDVVLAVMTPQVERTARRAGVTFRRTDFPIRRDSIGIKKLIIKYHDYFLPELAIDGTAPTPEQIEAASASDLDKWLQGLSDGPALWWTMPKQLDDLMIS